MLRVFECFSGYGSQSLGLSRLGIEHKVVGISEISESAIKAYELLHNDTVKNYGDIKNIDIKDLPEFDLFTYSFPCTDLSAAGKGKGFQGEQSSLLYECKKIIELKPKYLLMENVKNLVSKRYKNDFDDWLGYLESLGYVNSWFVLNARDYGVPQNRERVFCISIYKGYNIPIPMKCVCNSIEDYLEKDEKRISYYNGGLEEYMPDGFAAYRGRVKNGKYVQNLEYHCGDYVNTITTVRKDNIVVKDGKRRYLSYRENFKLMGLLDSEIDKLEGNLSGTQMLQLAANSIVIEVLMAIYMVMFEEEM